MYRSQEHTTTTTTTAEEEEVAYASSSSGRYNREQLVNNNDNLNINNNLNENKNEGGVVSGEEREVSGAEGVNDKNNINVDSDDIRLSRLLFPSKVVALTPGNRFDPSVR